MRGSWLGQGFVSGVFVVCSLVGSVASAEGEPCYRDIDCAGTEVCNERECAAPEVEPQTCAGDGFCDERRELCVGGYCKDTGVRCEGPTGECVAEVDRHECNCADGGAWGGLDDPGQDPPEPMPAEELYEICLEDLAAMCPDLPPEDTGSDGTDGSTEGTGDPPGGSSGGDGGGTPGGGDTDTGAGDDEDPGDTAGEEEGDGEGGSTRKGCSIDRELVPCGWLWAIVIAVAVRRRSRP